HPGCHVVDVVGEDRGRRQGEVRADDVPDIGVVAAGGEVPDRERLAVRPGSQPREEVRHEEAAALPGSDVVERPGDDAVEAAPAVVGELILDENLAHDVRGGESKGVRLPARRVVVVLGIYGATADSDDTRGGCGIQ